MSVFPKSLTKVWFAVLIKLGSYRIAVGLGHAGLLVIVRRQDVQLMLA